MATASHELDLPPMMLTPAAGLAELYERHYAAVFHTALRITGNPADAEDVLQTVFLRVFNQSDAIDRVGLPGAYFRRAAANAAVDLLRRRTSHAESPLAEASGHAVVESPVLLKERLRRAIATLEKSDAVVFLLRYVEGFSNAELAEMLGQEKNNIAVRLHRIRQALQIQLER
jgi:RNA polymerase sigma-70 factor (ECF subfamily)